MGGKIKYATDEERKQAKREQSLKSYKKRYNNDPEFRKLQQQRTAMSIYKRMKRLQEQQDADE